MNAGGSRPKAFVYSLVRPGHGEFYKGKTKARPFLLGGDPCRGARRLTIKAGSEFAVDDFEVCVEHFDAKDNSIGEGAESGRRSTVSGATSNARRNRRDASLIVLAALWGWNVIDTFIPAGTTSPPSAHST